MLSLCSLVHFVSGGWLGMCDLAWGLLGQLFNQSAAALVTPVGFSLITCRAVVIKQWPRKKPFCWTAQDPGLKRTIPQRQGWGHSVPNPLPTCRELPANMQRIGCRCVWSQKRSRNGMNAFISMMGLYYTWLAGFIFIENVKHKKALFWGLNTNQLSRKKNCVLERIEYPLRTYWVCSNLQLAFFVAVVAEDNSTNNTCT